MAATQSDMANWSWKYLAQISMSNTGRHASLDVQMPVLQFESNSNGADAVDRQCERQHLQSTLIHAGTFMEMEVVCFEQKPTFANPESEGEIQITIDNVRETKSRARAGSFRCGGPTRI
jgi:hypothetical protein